MNKIFLILLDKNLFTVKIKIYIYEKTVLFLHCRVSDD